MSDPSDAPATLSHADLATRRRKIAEQLAVEATAWSADGRTFSCETSLAEAPTAGEFAELRTGDGRRYFGQVLDASVVERDGPAISVAGDAGLGVSHETAQISQMTFTMRLRNARAAGALLGRFEGDRIAPLAGDDRFDMATITPAPAKTVAAYLAGAFGDKTALPIGTVAGLDTPTPASLLAGGFGRHTFLVGQSGSGKTYSLGVILEQLLLETDLRIAIIDPNSDYVRLGDLRDEAVAAHPEDAERYRQAVANIKVLRPAGRTAPGEPALRLWYSELTERVQALILQIDPIADRDEYEAFRSIVRQLGGDRYSLRNVQEAAGRNLSIESRKLALRIAALGIADWELWAHGDEPLLRENLGDWRALILDVGGFQNAEEKSVIANGLLGMFWHLRDQRQPFLIVIDEAHNICPQDPEEPIQAMATQRAISIAAEGRKFGLYLLLSTQRPSKIHINVLSQCDNLVLMRMNSTEDVKALTHVFSFVPPTLMERSAAFVQGESLVAGKISPIPNLVRFGRRYSHEGGSDVPDTWTRPADRG